MNFLPVRRVLWWGPRQEPGIQSSPLSTSQELLLKMLLSSRYQTGLALLHHDLQILKKMVNKELFLKRLDTLGRFFAVLYKGFL